MGRIGPLPPKDFVAINGVVIVIYVSWRRYTHCLLLLVAMLVLTPHLLQWRSLSIFISNVALLPYPVSSTPVPGFALPVVGRLVGLVVGHVSLVVVGGTR